jgi:hypothetical protein
MMRDFVETAFAARNERYNRDFGWLPGYHTSEPVIVTKQIKRYRLSETEMAHFQRFSLQNYDHDVGEDQPVYQFKLANLNGIDVRPVGNERYLKTRDSVVCARYTTDQDDEERYVCFARTRSIAISVLAQICTSVLCTVQLRICRSTAHLSSW